MRIGHGFDVHKLTIGRKLILGGIHIPYKMGLKGHSDADVLIHSVMDSLLGAACLGDIGKLFPDTDDQYKDISSMKLLDEVYDRLKEIGYTIKNIDVTVVAEKPKLSPYIDKMKGNICSILDLEDSQINIKATTTENLGFTGREEGIASYAVCLISKD